ncbi:MAG: hypothetical protein R6X09_07390 [Bacteroidales bacterium]
MKKNAMLLILAFSCIGMNAQWKSYPTNAKFVTHMYEDKQGNVWFLNRESLSRSCLVKFNGQQVENLKTLDKARTDCVFEMLEGPDGKLYAATMYGLAVCDNGQWSVKDNNNGLPANLVKDAHFDKNGTLWLFHAKGFNSGIVGKYTNGTYEPVNMEGHTGRAIRTVFEDRDGNIWTGMHLGNAASFDGTKWTDHTAAAKCKHVSQIAQDTKGRIWIAGIEGQFACLDNGNWKSFKYGSGYFSPYSAPLMIIALVPGIIAGYAGPDITSWGDLVTDSNSDAWMLARKYGVAVSDGNDYESAEKKYQAPKTKKATDIMTDSKGNIWMSLSTGEVYKYDFSNWTVYNQKDGLPAKLTAIFETENGDIWVAGKNNIAVLNK